MCSTAELALHEESRETSYPERNTGSFRLLATGNFG
jgi:hypothetical protein